MRIFYLVIILTSLASAETDWQQIQQDLSELNHELANYKQNNSYKLEPEQQVTPFYTWIKAKADWQSSDAPEKYAQLMHAINTKNYRKAQILARRIIAKEPDVKIEANSLAILVDLAMMFHEYQSAGDYLAILKHKHPSYLPAKKTLYLEWMLGYTCANKSQLSDSAQALLKYYPKSLEASSVKQYHASMLKDISPNSES